MTRRATSSSPYQNPYPPTHQCIRFSPGACMMRVSLITASTYNAARLQRIHQFLPQTAPEG